MKGPYFQKQGVPWGNHICISLLAITKFQNALGDTLRVNLLSLGSPTTDYYISLAKYFYFSDKKSFNLVINQIKTVVYFAEEALKINPKKVVEGFRKIEPLYKKDLEQLFEAHEKMDKKSNATITSNIKNILESYHTFYEQGFKRLITFPIICKEILFHSPELVKKSVEEYINDDPSYKIKKINSNLIIGGYQTTILLEGYDNRVRNAIAHRYIEIPDPDKEEVVLKDKDWSKKFSYEEIKNLTEKFEKTIKALELGMGVFYANNSDTIEKYSPAEKPPTPHELRGVLYSTFESLGFDIKKVKKTDGVFGCIKIIAKMRPRLTKCKEGESDLYWSDGARKYHIKLPPVDLSISIRDNSLGAFGRSGGVLKWFNKVDIDILDDNNKIKAKIRCSNPRDFLKKLKGCKSREETDEIVEKFNLYKEV